MNNSTQNTDNENISFDIKAAIGNLSIYIGKISESLISAEKEKKALLEQNNQLFSDIDTLESKLSEIEDLKHGKSELTDRYKEAEGKIAELERLLKERDNELAEKNQDIEVLSAEKQDFISALAEKDEIQKNLEYAQKEIARRNISGNQRDEKQQELRDKLANLEAELYKAKDSNQKLQSQIEEKEIIIGELGAEKAELEVKLEGIELVRKANDSAIGNYKELIENLEDDNKLLLANLKEAESKQENLRHDIDEFEEERETLNHQIQSLRDDLKLKTSELETINAKYQELITELRDTKAELDDSQKQVQQISEKDNALESSIENNIAKTREYESRIVKLEQQLSESENILNELDNKNLELIKQVTELEKEKINYSNLENINTRLSEELESSRNANFKLREKMQEIAKELESKRKNEPEPGQISLDEMRIEKLEDVLKSRYQQISILEDEINEYQKKNTQKDILIRKVIDNIELANSKIDSLYQKI